MLLFGIDKRDITPSRPCRMAGYNREGFSSFVLDSIQINSISFSIYQETYLLCVLDSIMLEQEFCNRVKAGIVAQSGLNPEHITVACIHTHSAPAYFKLSFENTQVEPELTAAAENDMIESGLRAWRSMQPAHAILETLEIDGLYGNRNVKNGVEDKRCYLISFLDAAEKRLGAFFNISAHPTILNGSSTALSADLIGQIRLRLENELNCSVLCTNGTCGDVSTRFYRKASGIDELMTTADELFTQIMEKKDVAELRGGPVTSGSVELPTTFDATADPDWMEMTGRIQAELKSGNPSPMADFFMARQNLKREQSPIHLNLISQYYVLGNLIVVTLPGDVCSELGRRIKSAFPNYQVIIIAYANTYCNYLVPEEDYGKYFETFNSRTSRGEADRLIARVIDSIESSVND